MSETTEFTIEAGPLRTALTTALTFADSGDGIHPMLGCVNFRPAEGGIEISATDRYIAGWEIAKVTGEPFAMLVPAHIAKRLLTMMPKGTVRRPVAGMVSITLDDGKVTVRFLGGIEEFETSVSFTPPDYGTFPDLAKTAAKAADIAKDDLTSSVHVDPRFLARVARAVAARGPLEPMEMTFLTASKPVQIKADGFNAIVMPVRRAAKETTR